VADSTPPEIKPSLSERDKELIGRHKTVKEEYAPGTKRGQEWAEMTPVSLKTAEEIAETIIFANILPAPLNPQDVLVLVSLSSNVGINERVLAEKLGNSYKVIAGDVADVQRLPSGATPMRFDASFLPFKENSIAAMTDFQGAIWHEAFEDLTKGYNQKTEADNLIDIFARLKPSLREGGVIIVDDPEHFLLAMIGTTSKIDQILTLTGEKIEGFEVSTIGEGNRRLRVYKKVT